MPPEQKAAWIRRAFLVALIGSAAAAGYFFTMPGGCDEKAKERPDTAVQVTKKNIDEVQGKPGVLTITNMRLDGNPNPKKLQQLLEKLKQEDYGEKVQLAQADIKQEPEIAAAPGIVDLEQFAGPLDFHSEGKKLGNLIGETDPVVVEATVDRILAGLVRRIDKTWLPDVPGMERNRGQPVIQVHPAKKAMGTVP